MTANQLKSILDESKLPVAYDHFQEPQTVPYVIFRLAYTNNAFGDDKVLKVRNRWNVHLYTKIKDIANEDLIESIFDKNVLAWNKTETYLDDQSLYQTIYEIMEG